MLTSKVKIAGEIQSSPIALGCMRLAGVEDKTVDRIIHTAVDQGITLFDHADIYGGGESERVFGEVMRNDPGLRHKIQILDKCGICQGYYDSSKEHILSAVNASLSRLGIEQLDFLLLHRPDVLIEPDKVAEAFDELFASGKVRCFGVSNYNADQLDLLQKSVRQKLSINQLQFGLAHTALLDESINVNIHSPHAVSKTNGTLNYCRINHITIQAWSPLQQGMFAGAFLTSDKYTALNETLLTLANEKNVSVVAVAIAWILRHPSHFQPIIGTTNVERLIDMCMADTITLSRSEWYSLYKAAGNPLP